MSSAMPYSECILSTPNASHRILWNSALGISSRYPFMPPVSMTIVSSSFGAQVAGQQCVEAPPCRFAVERPERSAERLFVERQRAHRVARRGHAGGGRRSEDRFGLRAAAIHFVGLEKPDRQVGNTSSAAASNAASSAMRNMSSGVLIECKDRK